MPDRDDCPRVAAAVAGGLLLPLLATASHAIITHPQDDPDLGRFRTPPPSAIGRWNVDGAANASAVAIDPNYIITTRHQDAGASGVGTIVQFGTSRYRVAQETTIGTADLRVLRIIQENNSNPANLSVFTPLFTGNDNPSAPLAIALGGFGRPRGDTLLDSSGDPYGYAWKTDLDNNPATPDTVNQTSLAFGRNVIEGIAQAVSPYPFPSDLLACDFDAPGVSPVEAIPSEFDSGSGWFVELTPGVWRVVALSALLRHDSVNNAQPLSTSLFAASNNAGNLAPDGFAGIRLSSYATQIGNSVVTPQVAGDFNNDLVANAADIDLLCDAINANGPLSTFDVNHDGQLNSNDLAYQVQTILNTTFGDTDTDGDVDLADLGNLATGFGQPTEKRWSRGNFDCDGDVDLSDLGTLATHFEAGTAAALTQFEALMPEPTAAASLLALGGLLCGQRRGRK